MSAATTTQTPIVKAGESKLPVNGATVSPAVPEIYSLDLGAVQNQAAAKAVPPSIPMKTAPERAPSSTITPEQHDLILSMLPLVKTIVGRIAINLPSHISQEDLLSAGVMGLM